MPIPISADAPTLLIRRDAFERVGMTRAALDARYNLTDAEFVLEGHLIAVGPLAGETSATALIEELEREGLVYHDDFFEMPGGWPSWIKVLAMGGR